MPYAIEHQGRAFLPEKLIDVDGNPVDVVKTWGSVEAYNAAVETAEHEHLHTTKPERFVAYMSSDMKSITLFTGRVISARVYVWNKRRNPRVSYTSSHVWSVNVLTTWGDWYCGTSLGGGIYVKLRKMKRPPR